MTEFNTYIHSLVDKEKLERAKNIEEFWNSLNTGKSFNGTIAKIESYGMFVDLGLVRGLLQVSEYLLQVAKRHIEGEISIEQARILIDSFYDS